MPDRSNQARGRWGEQRAVDHLRAHGCSIVDRNWRSSHRDVRGELDIVALQAGCLVFCEVKARRRGSLGGAVAAVGPAKQAQVRALAGRWLRAHPDVGHDGVRFDVVAIDGVHLRWWQGVF